MCVCIISPWIYKIICILNTLYNWQSRGRNERKRIYSFTIWHLKKICFIVDERSIWTICHWKRGYSLEDIAWWNMSIQICELATLYYSILFLTLRADIAGETLTIITNKMIDCRTLYRTHGLFGPISKQDFTNHRNIRDARRRAQPFVWTGYCS